MTVDKKTIWKIAFYISVVIYVINMICMIVAGSCMFFTSCSAYNYISAILNAVFLITFYKFLIKGSLTLRYIFIMFSVLVVFPFFVALIFGGIGFS
ncbi:MAG: hypothetical protein J7L77_08010 [Clostridiales bacterium]|nr:hypothetical protein [Clostridiales bacterium]